MSTGKFKGTGLASRCIGLAQYDSTDFAHWVKSGVIERVVINTANTLGAISLFDADQSAAGTALVVLPLGIAGGSTVELGIVCNTALTVDLAGADDVTVVYANNVV